MSWKKKCCLFSRCDTSGHTDEFLNRHFAVFLPDLIDNEARHEGGRDRRANGVCSSQTKHDKCLWATFAISRCSEVFLCCLPKK